MRLTNEEILEINKQNQAFDRLQLELKFSQQVVEKLQLEAKINRLISENGILRLYLKYGLNPTTHIISQEGEFEEVTKGNNNG